MSTRPGVVFALLGKPDERIKSGRYDNSGDGQPLRDGLVGVKSCRRRGFASVKAADGSKAGKETQSVNAATANAHEPARAPWVADVSFMRPGHR